VRGSETVADRARHQSGCDRRIDAARERADGASLADARANIGNGLVDE